MIAVHQCAALPRDGAEQFVERIRELLNALDNQFVGDLLQRDAVALQFGDHRASRLDVVLDGVGFRLPVVTESVHRRRRNGVHGVAADQRLDIHRIFVGRIFGTRGSPEQSLRPCARRRQTLPARPGEQRLVANVSEFCVGNSRPAAQPTHQLFIAELFQPLVDR